MDYMLGSPFLDVKAKVGTWINNRSSRVGIASGAATTVGLCSCGRIEAGDPS